MAFAEYLWLDGAEPVSQLRSKARFVDLGGGKPSAEDFPSWNFDGSSTNQASGSDSDCTLVPVAVAKDPTRSGESYIVMCEVFGAEGEAHATNNRARLRAILTAGAAAQDAWIGFEQEYTLFKDGRPLGWPQHGYPEPQGPYYCSVGADRAFGRDVVELHARHCIDAGLLFYGLNAEVMPGQWEFQIGYRGRADEDPSLLKASDHLWMARWLLHRAAEAHGVIASFDNKPRKGDWNGAGMHTNFSTAEMRTANRGLDAIEEAVCRLSAKHADHIAVYGHGLADRLTGLHETCAIDEFRAGASDRGASIRVPRAVQRCGAGYLEDRRPGANADPYLVAARLAATICDVDDAVISRQAIAGDNKTKRAA